MKMLGDAAFFCVCVVVIHVSRLPADLFRQWVPIEQRRQFLRRVGNRFFSGNGLVSRAEQDSAARHTGKKGDPEQRFGWDCL